MRGQRPRPQLRRRRLLHRHQQSAGHARCRLLLVAHRLQRAQGAHDGRRVRAVGSSRSRASTSSLNGSSSKPKFDSTVRRRHRRGDRRHPRRQPPADACRSSRSRPARATASRSPTAPKAYVGASFQHVGSRYTQPSDQENNPRSFVSGLPFGGATGDRRDRGRPEAALLQLRQPQRRASTGTTASA